MEYSIIANSGLQLYTFPFEIDLNSNFKRWFHEWYDKEEGVHKLDLVERIKGDEGTYYYNKKGLIDKGYISAFETVHNVNPDEIREDGIIHPLTEENSDDGNNILQDIFAMTFTDSQSKLSFYENKWIPLPYFRRRMPALRFDFGAFNWVRVKLIPQEEEEGKKKYIALLVVDTRMNYEETELKETPVFPDNFQNQLTYQLCADEMLLMDYCSEATEECSYINEYLRKLVHPEARTISKIKGEKHKMSYIATYYLLVNYLATKSIFPTLNLWKDENVITKDVDMFIDIGNSRTTAIMVEDPQNGNFTKASLLSLTDFTNSIVMTKQGPQIRCHNKPFDMRLAFRKADFGDFGPRDSRQFIYPSLVRLGTEAIDLIHMANDSGEESLSTYSSPKRYLWDKDAAQHEWQYLTIGNENQSHILELKGITNQLNSNGTIDMDGIGGGKHTYSRSSLMTFAFLEILSQARMQINSEDYRRFHGETSVPRRLKRLIVTCPITMSQQERETLIKCVNSAVKLLSNFEKDSFATDFRTQKFDIDVIPSYRKKGSNTWYYDEATCSQLVYLYGEIGHKFKGNSKEFFRLYGKTDEQGDPCFTVGSLDIGAGTSDLMINKYYLSEEQDAIIAPNPIFYDSYYYAGDDMLQELIRESILTGENSALVNKVGQQSLQKIKDFFGHNYNGQSISQRILRRDFNIQVLVPLACYYLELCRTNSNDCTIKYDEIFQDTEPNQKVLDGFQDFFGFDFRELEWEYVSQNVINIVTHSFDTLAKRISAIMFTYNCDIIVLSGRPATLPPLKELFMKYYAVAPNRLIQLSEYYIGDWYPFGNNTGYIHNPKTVVAVGAMIGFYSSEQIQFTDFKLDKKGLDKLQSTTNYVETPDSVAFHTEYCITPTQNRGEILAKQLPVSLKICHENFDNYPDRPLYEINFNIGGIISRLRRQKESTDPSISEEALVNLAANEVNRLRALLPYHIVLSRNPENKEDIYIEQITDVQGNDVSENNVRISIQSLGPADCYWLDSGVFEF